jgi:hypothetical protein
MTALAGSAAAVNNPAPDEHLTLQARQTNVTLQQ